MNARTRLLACGAASLLMLADCGGNDDSANPSSTTSTVPVTTTSTTSTTSTPSVTTTAEPAVESTGLPLVVDTDLAADDIVALSYLSSRPDVEILAVTISGTGEVHCPRGADVARGLLAAMGRPDVPVACGSTTPLSGSRQFPEAWRTAADDAYGLPLGATTAPSAVQSAADLLVDTVTRSSTPVVLLTLAPLTNVAEAFAAAPDEMSHVARVVVMGGALEVEGNVQPDGAPQPLPAEWNFFVDPAAAAAVVGSDAAVTLVTLDATSRVPVTETVIERLAANDTTGATARVRQLFDQYPPPYLWDPLAAIAAAESGLVPTHHAEVAVVTDGGDAGRTVIRPGGASVSVADAPGAGAVIGHLLKTLAGVPEDGRLAVPTTLPVLGDMTIGFDGATCAYDGPETLPAGAYVVTAAAGPVEFVVGIAHLVDGATVDDLQAWLVEHPNEDPTMIDDLELVGGTSKPSSASVVFPAGTVVIGCGADDGIHLGAAVEVTE